MKLVSRIAALIIALAMALMLVACGGAAPDSASSDAGSSASEAASQSATESEAESAAEGTTEGEGSSAAPHELMGKPWVTSVLQGNLPTDQPELKDDLFTHYNYEYLAAHQTVTASTMTDCATELQTANLAIIKDSSKSNHDLDQLRIFFEQAADAEAVKEAGVSELQPYFERIDAVSSIEDMNKLLASDDFPFSPFVLAYVTSSDTRDVNIVAVSANLALVDTISVGGAYYQDTDDPQVQESMDAAIMNTAMVAMLDFSAANTEQKTPKDLLPTLIEFEKAHGKYVDYNGKYSTQDFGAAAEAMRNSFFTLDELCAACPNFPMKETLDKMGKAGSPRYLVTREWPEAFNKVWTTENIEAIKTIAKMQLLAETRPYRDPSIMNELYEAANMPVPDAESFAYEACNQQDTFAIALSEMYVNETLGDKAKTRLTELSQQIVDTYKGLIGETSWLSDESKQHVIEKLDHMTLNVLEPAGGYYDFSGLELTPTDQGGTLIGNFLKLKQYRLDQESKMVGQPVVPASSWFFIRPTEMNAFYDPVCNSINIIPGFVTSLMYTDDMSDIELLSGIGFTIGHEISHGFDYQGAQSDAYGTPTPIFADADVDAFVLKASTLALYYKGLEIAPDTMVNGENVVTEAAADLCGMQAVLELAAKTENPDYSALFKRVSEVWAQTLPESMLPNLVLDTHALNNHRVNVNAQMFDPLYEELGVAEGDTMYLAPQERINIWGPNA